MASPVLPTLRRALLYVPASSPRFLARSANLKVDNVTYDLEDSVTNDKKVEARSALLEYLINLPLPSPSGSFSPREIAVRVNDVSTPWAIEDILTFAPLPQVQALVIPKVNSAADLTTVVDAIRRAAPHRLGIPTTTTAESNPNHPNPKPLAILALIESARAIMDLREICAAHAATTTITTPPNHLLRGLIFAAEDFALDMNLRRTEGMAEMAYARSAVVTAARAFGLESAIDVVRTAFKGGDAMEGLKRESEEGAGMGFTGKQCIHPSQVSIVQEQFSPSVRDIIKSACLVVADEKAVALGKGSFGFSDSMVDAPVSKKARSTLAIAQRLGVNVQQLKRDVDFEDETMPDWNRRIGIVYEQQGLALRKTMGFDTDVN
ncbi:Pyruvate/Phosphoenolpyruvate kinase-like domain-containing protein [Dichotomopilus funicola]|uniref:Pyruvate/Phosphoenolpyruvate kinase-like domain-containing protein n=1 Tax=Dichotomopilus funicola TaxID=1934379 RepID=A0AAN6V6Y3_9PEZI|nr:Pyruvate/Phosphoenolpyruvate kinase-like domain-containing protein [Dichotomopilus funicola]